MMDRIAFGVVAALLLFSALRVVTSKNLVHSVLWLGGTLIATAVAYVLLSSPFLAAIQILLYTGGVITLMLFGVMLTRRGDDMTIPNESNEKGRAALLSIATFGLFAGAVLKTPLPAEARPPASGGTEALGQLIFGPYLLAFEVLSVLLLAAMVGAIVIARRRDAAVDRAPVGLDLSARDSKATSAEGGE